MTIDEALEAKRYEVERFGSRVTLYDRAKDIDFGEVVIAEAHAALVEEVKRLRKCPPDNVALQVRVGELLQEVDRLRDAVNGAYRERAMLVALLAALWPSTLSSGQDEDEWSVVHIDGPVGQMGWHIAPEYLDLFEHVRRGMNHWDGHGTPEKFRRIRETTALLTTEAPHE